jgi:hypothetical protein
MVFEHKYRGGEGNLDRLGRWLGDEHGCRHDERNTGLTMLNYLWSFL